MNEPSENQLQATRADNKGSSTFESFFFDRDNALPVRVPDYQRAYSWEEKQIELFIGDLVKYQGVGKGYYFGHFIAQNIGKHWEIVDGQQRITTFVLFLMVCRVLSPSGAHGCAYSMIEQFSTVSYDDEALKTIGRELRPFLEANGHFDEQKPPKDDRIIAALALEGNFTRSQRRMVFALLRFHQAFLAEGKQKDRLEREKIGDYTAAVMEAHCSLHLAPDQSVAVNIFEMHNTRGIPLTTLEIIKAMLMKFVYEHGGENRKSKVEQIQAEFGEIYGMEERLAARSFRGEMEMKHLLYLHLRVVDDGTKKNEKDFHSPATNADSDALVAYVDSRLQFIDGDKTQPKDPEYGVKYALNLAKEFKKSVRIVSENLPEWDTKDTLVGDVLILDQDWSCQFFLIICRRLESGLDEANGRIGKDTLLLWEKLLFTRDFHGEYHGKSHRDNFQKLFASCLVDGEQITNVIKNYLADGFRPRDVTKGLQSIVKSYLKSYEKNILNGAFEWWKSKMKYAIYKYEVSRGAKIREVMKGDFSVEHILPQDWHSIMDNDTDEDLKKKSGEKWESFRKEIDDCINGIGNLLLIPRAENSSMKNKHPADKQYFCTGGSYEDHNQNRKKWKSSKEWSKLIRERGEKIFDFMLGTLVGDK